MNIQNFIIVLTYMLNIKINNVYSGPWSRAQREVKEGGIDLIAGAFFTTARAQYMDYIDPAFLTTRSVVWTSRSKPIDYKQKEDLSYEPIRSDEYEYTDLPELRIKSLKIIEREPEKYSAFRNNFNGDWLYLTNTQTRFYYYNFYQSIGKRILSKKTTKEYENGLETLASATSYGYGNTDHMQQTSISITNSKGTLLKTKIDYPQDLASKTNAEQDLIAKHQWAIPIKTETFKKEGTNAEEKLSSQYTVYKYLSSIEQNLPEIVKTSKGTNALEDRIVFHQYYDNGNVKEVSKKDGTPIVYIWGYNEEYPIAKIENATYNQVSSQVNNLHSKSDDDDDRTIGNVGNEGDLRSALTSLRNSLPNAMVTTFTFDPLIGVTSMTDPKGNVIYYEYDNANRLKQVKDKNGKILSENEYHYKSQ